MKNTMLPTQGQSFGGFHDEDSDSSSGSSVSVGSGHHDMHETRTGGHAALHKKTRRELVQELMEMLEGTELNRTLAVVSFALACCAELFGIFSPLEHIQASYRSFVFLAAVFLVNQSFFLIKSLRDGEIINGMPDPNPNQDYFPKSHGGGGHGHENDEHHKRRPPAELAFLKGILTNKDGTSKGGLAGECPMHVFMCCFGLLLSLICGVFGILAMDAKRHTKMFIGLATIFMISSSMNLAMTMRDRFENSVWDDEITHRHITSKRAELAVRNVVKVLASHHWQFLAMFFVMGGAALGILIFAMIDFGLKEKGIGLLSAGMFMTLACGWNLARVLNMTKEEAKKSHMTNELSVLVSFVISITLTAVGLVLIELELYKKIVLGLGIFILLDTTFNFAKVQHRHTHIEKLNTRLNHKFKLNPMLEPFHSSKHGHGHGHGDQRTITTHHSPEAKKKPAAAKKKP